MRADPDKTVEVFVQRRRAATIEAKRILSLDMSLDAPAVALNEDENDGAPDYDEDGDAEQLSGVPALPACTSTTSLLLLFPPC